MERHKCKLCFRNFANGRALGGHMRSHMMNLYATKKSSKKEEDDDDEEFHSSSSQEEGEIDPNDQESSRDGQSETESSRRSKRVRKSRIFYSDKSPNNENSPLSSISEIIITPDEDVAYCLMMMSRDKWGKENDDFGVEKVNKSKVKGKYKCETCCRSFRSYQALGGHRASHKKIKVNAPPLDGGPAAAVVEEKIHECPFCQRVFASGQALGGHKRSHFIAAPTIPSSLTTIKQISRNCENLDIDLNLPAPIDDDDDNISY